MKHSVPRLCLLLLTVSMCWSAGCTNTNMNPAYFPFLFPTPYHNYDPDFVRLEVQPIVEVTKPVRTEHVILVGAYGKSIALDRKDKDKEVPRRGRQIEFMISGAGHI